jgi:hypothetical protein
MKINSKIKEKILKDLFSEFYSTKSINLNHDPIPSNISNPSSSVFLKVFPKNEKIIPIENNESDNFRLFNNTLNNIYII